MTPPPDKQPTWKPDRCPQKHNGKWRDRIRLGMEFIGLLAVIYYAHQAQIQADANRTAADAAKSSADVARGQSRPWVVLDQLVFSNQERTDTTASIKNVGGGPAFNVGFAYECGIVFQDESLTNEAADYIDRARTRILWWPSTLKWDTLRYLLSGSDWISAEAALQNTSSDEK